MTEAQGRDEETELDNFRGEPAPPTPETPHHQQPDENEPVNKEHVTKCSLLKVITFTFVLDLISYFISARLL